MQSTEAVGEHGRLAEDEDATAAARVEEGNGYDAALINFRYLASAVWTTEEAKAAIEKAVDPSTEE